MHARSYLVFMFKTMAVKPELENSGSQLSVGDIRIWCRLSHQCPDGPA